jgi:peptide/nickel transport system permease protein
MPTLISYLLRRLVFLLATLFFTTFLLFGIFSTFPVETRAMLYFPKNPGSHFNDASSNVILNDIIKRHGLNDPFPVQYFHWVGNLLRGEWGWSQTAQAGVLDSLIRLTPATAELTLYSLLLFIPLGILSGVVAGEHQNQRLDRFIRLNAFLATSLPPFILAILLMAVFYVSLQWFPPGRLADSLNFVIRERSFIQYTGFITLDGLLNGRPDISLDALRHLILPVITLSAFHWSTLTRVTRVLMQEELKKDYIMAAHARGIPEHRIIWRHALPNTLAPALNTSMLSAASLITGVVVVESIFAFPGISNFLRNSLVATPDVPAALGFSVYTIIVVLVLMAILDIVQALVDPRYRLGVEK